MRTLDLVERAQSPRSLSPVQDQFQACPEKCPHPERFVKHRLAPVVKGRWRFAGPRGPAGLKFVAWLEESPCLLREAGL